MASAAEHCKAGDSGFDALRQIFGPVDSACQTFRGRSVYHFITHRFPLFSRLLLTESDTTNLGADLAALARPGDVIALVGDLGAGKSVLARGFIRALAGQDIDVPSPTFTLLQTYETSTAVVWHFDLYRLEGPDEIWELGVEDAFDEGISLFEWPGNGSSAIPADRLTITLTIQPDEARLASLSGGPSWTDRLKGLPGDG